MNQIGLRDLHEHTSKVLCEVRDEQVEYVVTQRGEPIARLLPVRSERPRESPPTQGEAAAWTRYVELAESLGRDWPEDRPTQVVLDEIRR